LVNAHIALLLNSLENNYEKNKQLQFFTNQMKSFQKGGKKSAFKKESKKGIHFRTEGYAGSQAERDVSREIATRLNSLATDLEKSWQLFFFTQQVEAKRS
jgi:hypothetical protein